MNANERPLSRQKTNAAFGVAWFFSRKLANPYRWCSIACSRRLFARVHYFVNSQTRTVGALLPACAGCLLVIAAKNQMPPSASLVFLLAYIIS